MTAPRHESLRPDMQKACIHSKGSTMTANNPEQAENSNTKTRRTRDEDDWRSHAGAPSVCRITQSIEDDKRLKSDQERQNTSQGLQNAKLTSYARNRNAQVPRKRSHVSVDGIDANVLHNKPWRREFEGSSLGELLRCWAWTRTSRKVLRTRRLANEALQ